MGSALCVAAMVIACGNALHASEEAKPARPKDAAEAVGEGNVQQWIEYYQRTRPPTEPVVRRPNEPNAAKPSEKVPQEQQKSSP